MTVFTKIINGQIPGRFVWSDSECVAFLTAEPLQPGHTLVVSREEIDHWLDVPDDLAQHLFAVARHIGRAQREEFEPTRVGLLDRKSTRLNSSHVAISYAVFCLKKNNRN